MEELQQQRTQPTASASQLPRPSAASREQSVRQLPAVVTQNVATQNGNAVTTSTTALPSSPTRSMRSLSPANNTFGSMYRLNAEAGGAPMAPELMAQVAHERLRYSQLASSYQDLQRSHAEVQANLEDYQELINAMEVQCEESDRERIRNEVELREARQEIAALRERVEAAGAKPVVGDNEHGEEATPSVKAALAKELKVQKRLLDDQSTTLLEKDREIQSLKRQLNAYQSMRRPSAAGVHRRLSSAGAQAAGNTSLRRQSIGSDASLSFMAAGSDAAQAPGDVSPEASHAEMVVDYVERFTERTRTAVDEKINELYSFASPAAARTPGHGKSLMDVPALDLNRTPTNMTVNNERPQSALTVNDLKQSVIQKSRSLLQQLASVQQALTRSQRVAHNVTQDFGPSAELQTSLFDILTELTENMDRAADTEREYERALFEKDGLIQKLQSKLRAMKEKVTVATGVTSMPATPNVKASTSSIWLGSLADLTHEDKMAAEATDAVIERNRELQGKVDELEGALEAVTNRLQAAEQMPPSETFQGALRELEKRINEKSLDESKTASMEVRYNREHRHVLQLELEKITMREQIDSLNARHSELETELREAIHEKNKMERAHRCTQESIEVLESQKSKLERLLKTAESVVADRDKLIRVMEERQTSFTTTDMGLGSPRSPRSAPPQVRELERALNEKQHQLIDYERRLELANSELRAMKSLASDTSATPSGQRSLQAECKRLTAEVSSLQKQLADVKTASEVKFNRQLKLAQEQRETDQQLLLAVTAQRDELETTVHQMRSATSVTSATTGSVVMQQTRTITDRNSASVASEMAQVKANLRVAQKENSELKLCVEEKEREILEVKTAKIEIDKQRQVIENRLGDLQSALKAATTDKMSAEHTLMCLRSDAQNTADRIAELEGELSRRQRALDTLGQEKQSLKTKFDEALRRVADLERIAEKGSEVERDYATISQENLGLRRQVDDFERQIKEFAGEKDMLKKKLAASSEELVQAESALKEVDGSAKNQAAMLKEKSRLVDKLQAEIDDVHAQYCTHTAEQQAEIKQLGEKVVARDAEIIAVRGQVEELTAEVTLKKQSIETLEKRIGSLKHSLEEMKNHAEELYQQQQMQLEEQRKETIDALDAAKVHLARVAEVEDEKRRLNSKNTELTASVQFLEDALADSKRTNELSSGNTHILEQRVAELQKELKQAQEKYHAFGADTARLSSEIDRLQAALKVRDAKISGKDEQLARNRAALEKVEEELGTSAEWGRRLTVTNHELEQKIKAAETELASTCAELDEKKRTVARLEKDARSKGDELAIAQRDISDAQLRVEVLEKDLQNAIERMETMRARNDELLDELDGVRKREGQSVDSLNDTERELHDRERQVAALENKVKALQTERDQYAAKVEKLSAAEKASRKQLDTLHVRVSKMTSTLEERETMLQLTESELAELKKLHGEAGDKLVHHDESRLAVITRAKTFHRVVVRQMETLQKAVDEKLQLQGVAMSHLQSQLKNAQYAMRRATSETSAARAQLAAKEKEAAISVAKLSTSLEQSVVELQDTKRTLEKAKRELRVLESQRTELVEVRSEFDATSNKTRKLEAEVSTLRSEVTTMEEQMEAAKHTADRLQQENAGLKEKHRIALDEASKLRDRLKSVESDSLKLYAKFDATTKDHAAAKAALHTKNTELASLSADLESKAAEVQQLQACLDSNEDALRAVQSELDTKSEQLQSALADVATLQERGIDDVDRLMCDNACLRDEIASKTQQFEEAAGRIAELTEYCASIEKLIQETAGASVTEAGVVSEESRNATVQQVVNIRTRIIDLETRIAKEKRSTEAAEELARHAETRCADFEKSIEVQQRTIKSLEKTNRSLKEAVGSLESRLAEAEREAENVKQKLRNLEHTDRTVAAKATAASAEAASLKSEAERLEKELKEVKAALEMKSGEALLAGMQMKDLQSRVQTLTIENESLNATIEDLEVRSQEALKKLHAELSNVNRQYTTYEEMSQSLQEVNEELRVKLETTTDDGRKLQQKMSEVQRERDQLLADVEMARDKQAILEQSVKELSETVANLQLHQAYIKGASSTAIHEPSAEEKMARIEREFREIKEHDAKLDAENERLRVRNEKLARDVDLMAHKNRKTTELGEKLVAEVEARRAEVNTLRTLMQQLREQNDTLSARINMGSEEAEFVKRQLSEAFGLLKTSSAEDEPMRENELDVDDEDEDEERMALTNNRNSPSYAKLPEPRPLGSTFAPSRSLLGSLANLTIPEIVVHYERKLQALQQLLLQGEEAVVNTENIMRMKEERRRARRKKEREALKAMTSVNNEKAETVKSAAATATTIKTTSTTITSTNNDRIRMF